jgi:hypothetical protein
MNWFKKEDPKEAVRKMKRETQREVRVRTRLKLQPLPCVAVRPNLALYIKGSDFLLRISHLFLLPILYILR